MFWVESLEIKTFSIKVANFVKFPFKNKRKGENKKKILDDVFTRIRKRASVSPVAQVVKQRPNHSTTNAQSN